MYLLDIISIARRYHLSLKGILIEAALIILSIWILVDKTEKSLFHLMTQCMRHSDLILVSSAIKTCKVLVDTACLHLSSSESEALFKMFFSSDQLISAVLRDQTS